MSNTTRPLAEPSTSAHPPAVEREELRSGYAAARVALHDLHALATRNAALTAAARIDDLRQQVADLTAYYLPLAHHVTATRQGQSYHFNGREHDSAVVVVLRAAQLVLTRVDGTGPEVAANAARAWTDRTVMLNVQRDLDVELAVVEGRQMGVPTGEPAAEKVTQRKPAAEVKNKEPSKKDQASTALVAFLDEHIPFGEGPAYMRDLYSPAKAPPGYRKKLLALLRAARVGDPPLVGEEEQASYWRRVDDRLRQYRKKQANTPSVRF